MGFVLLSVSVLQLRDLEDDIIQAVDQSADPLGDFEGDDAFAATDNSELEEEKENEEEEAGLLEADVEEDKKWSKKKKRKFARKFRGLLRRKKGRKGKAWRRWFARKLNGRRWGKKKAGENPPRRNFDEHEVGVVSGDGVG